MVLALGEHNGKIGMREVSYPVSSPPISGEDGQLSVPSRPRIETAEEWHPSGCGANLFCNSTNGVLDMMLSFSSKSEDEMDNEATMAEAKVAQACTHASASPGRQASADRVSSPVYQKRGRFLIWPVESTTLLAMPTMAASH